MPDSINVLLTQCINEVCYLNRKHEDWLLEENNQTTKVRFPRNESLGFSLDRQNFSPFGFFRKFPLSGVAKMCDAIFALSHKNKNYVFIVEQKTTRKNKYQKQLANGKHFCNWLFALLKEHGHYCGDIIYIGLLIWEPRESTDKGLSTHQKNNSLNQIPPSLKVHLNDFKDVRNQETIQLMDYLNG